MGVGKQARACRCRRRTQTSARHPSTSTAATAARRHRPLTLCEEVSRHHAGSILAGGHEGDKKVLDVKGAEAVGGAVYGAGLAVDVAQDAAQVCGRGGAGAEGGREAVGAGRQAGVVVVVAIMKGWVG